MKAQFMKLNVIAIVIEIVYFLSFSVAFNELVERKYANRGLFTCLKQQLVGESNPDKEKVIQEFQNRLHGPLNNKNMGLYVKAFMRYVYELFTAID